MPARALSGTCLERLVRMATPLLRAAQRRCPREGPGRLPDYQDWQMALLILIAVLNRRKSKSAQYRFLHECRAALQPWLHLQDFPARSTYFIRYRQAHRLFEQAIGLQGAKALAERVADATTVAVDKSLVAARGPVWHSHRRPSPGVDREAGWGYSDHDGWVWGYSFETVVAATPPIAGLPPAGLCRPRQCQRVSQFPRQNPAFAGRHTPRLGRPGLRQQRLPGSRRRRSPRPTHRPAFPLSPDPPRRQTRCRLLSATGTPRPTMPPTPAAAGVSPKPPRTTPLRTP